MKTIFTIIAAICLITTSILAQTPAQFKYQAVLRDADGQILTSPADITIKIYDVITGGVALYAETHTGVTPSAQGIINLNIGQLEPISGIDWRNGTYFIGVALGTGEELGRSQLLSVPYALMSKEVENVDYSQISNTPFIPTDLSDLTDDTDLLFSGNYNDLSGLPNIDGSETKLTAGTKVTITGSGTTASPYVENASISSATHYVGELYGGGVVFWVDNTGQHGLIASMIDLSTAQAWSNITDQFIGATAQSDWDGNANTTAIIGQSGTSSAAKLCAYYTNADYGNGTYSDWYLPSRGELNDLRSNLKAVQKTLDSDGNGSTTAITKNNYWSSSEYVDSNAWCFAFNAGVSGNGGKGTSYYVRAVRAF